MSRLIIRPPLFIARLAERGRCGRAAAGRSRRSQRNSCKCINDYPPARDEVFYFSPLIDFF